METWEQKEKTTKRIALILSLCLHLVLLASLTAYSNSDSQGSFVNWAKGLFQSDNAEQVDLAEPSA